MHIELLSYSATAPGAAGAAAAAITGDSLTIKNAKQKAQILAIWALNQTAGFHQLTFPSGHDTTRGFRVNVAASEVDMRLPIGLSLDVEPQETITATIAGSATAGDVEIGSMLVKYDDLPGVTARLKKWSEVSRQMEKLTTISFTLNSTAAGYTGEELINAESDLLMANRDYALLGFEVNTEIAAVYIRGTDTGNVKIGCPGNEQYPELTQGFFGMLSRAYDEATIPVINSGNKNSTYFGALMNENATGSLVTAHFALLKK
jgi:hypothetical protein